MLAYDHQPIMAMRIGAERRSRAQLAIDDWRGLRIEERPLAAVVQIEIPATYTCIAFIFHALRVYLACARSTLLKLRKMVTGWVTVPVT